MEKLKNLLYASLSAYGLCMLIRCRSNPGAKHDDEVIHSQSSDTLA